MAATRSSPRSIWLAVLLLLLVGACASDTPQPPTASDASGLARQPGGTLAHEHTLEVDIGRAALPAAHQMVIDACVAATDFSCTVLNSDLSIGEYGSAKLRLRVEPAGIAAIQEVVAGLGEITRQSTQVEDLADAIADTQARISMLTSQRDRLLQIEAEAANDVDALIKIAAELARIQSELERLAGDAANQKQRVETDILNIRLAGEPTIAFWQPIGEAFAGFSRDLSWGISDAVSGFARLAPWIVVLLPLFVVLRWVLRWTRTK